MTIPRRTVLRCCSVPLPTDFASNAARRAGLGWPVDGHHQHSGPEQGNRADDAHAAETPSCADHLGGDQLRPNALISTTPQSASVIVPVDVSVLNSPHS